MSEVRVVGIRVEQPQNQPVLLLRESAGIVTCPFGSASRRRQPSRWSNREWSPRGHSLMI